MLFLRSCFSYHQLPNLTYIAVLIYSLIFLRGEAEECHQYSSTIEAPCFEVVLSTETYEIRMYGTPLESFWTNAYIDSEDWATIQNDGFYKNFNYISGENNEDLTIPMTAPVLFRAAEAGGWHVSFFVPSSFESLEEIPIPDDPTVNIVSSDVRYFAVLEFGGFASEGDWEEKADELLVLLLEDSVKPVGGEWGVVYAGYDSPFVLFNRHNEVWIEIDGSSIETLRQSSL